MSTVLKSYGEGLEQAQALVAAGAAPAQVDAKIRVDDRPALDGLTVLLRESIAESEHDARRVYTALDSARVPT